MLPYQQDIAKILQLAQGHPTVFRPRDVDSLHRQLESFYTQLPNSHHLLFAQAGTVLRGFAYVTKIGGCSDEVYHLWWLIVAADGTHHGIGSELLTRAETWAFKRGAKAMVIETSSLPASEPARNFYKKHGYEVVGYINDYYGPNDAMVTFWKRLREAP